MEEAKNKTLNKEIDKLYKKGDLQSKLQKWPNNRRKAVSS